MSKRTYIPDRGDLIELNFQPAAGREIDKRRPAIVVTEMEYNRRAGLCLVVPTSTDLTPDTVRVLVPAGLLPRPSVAVCDYIKSVDYWERSATLLGRVPQAFFDEVISTVLDLIDPVK